jgi:integrase
MSTGREPDPDEVTDPIAYFIDDMTFHGKSDRTQEAYERVLRDFESFLVDGDTGDSTRLFNDAGRRDCMAWVHSLRGDHASSTVATYASYLHRFYNYMTQVGVFDGNPMGLVREEMDETIETDPTRREISLDEMRSLIASIGHPLEEALFVTLLKTGIRVGELCNLDLRDLHITGEVRDAFDVRPRAQLDGRGDSLYVASDADRGTVVNGEERTAANKRRRATIVPVDDELARALKRWLAIRPTSRSPAKPLFCSTGGEWGQRITPSMVRAIVRDHAEPRGWYRTGGTAEENVTPHYFRHFFTTHLRDRTGDRGIVKYLRGDVAEDIIDTYTHNWGDRVRDVYETNIYSVY